MSYAITIPEISGAIQKALKQCCQHWFVERCGEPADIIRCLEIGIYEGNNACWLLDNCLTHPQSMYFGVDYIGDHQEAHNRALSNMSRHKDKVVIIVGDSLKVVPEIAKAEHDPFDLIIVDGCHSYGGCLGDLQNSWPLLKSGGVLVCDDYYRSDYGIAQAVHEFLSKLAIVTDYQIIFCDYTIVIRKN